MANIKGKFELTLNELGNSLDMATELDIVITLKTPEGRKVTIRDAIKGRIVGMGGGQIRDYNFDFKMK